MFCQLISAVQNDENPRLHRVPFMLLWIMSYGLAWYAIDFYEWLRCELVLREFINWLKYNNDWSEKLVIGIIFGTVLTSFHSWLIRRRYGYLPKYWTLITWIGATLTAYGYP